MNIDWFKIATALTALSGAVGTVITSLYGGPLGQAVQAVIASIAGLLLVIPVGHVTSIAAAQYRIAKGIVSTHVLEVQK